MNLLDLEPATTLHFCPGLKSPWTHRGQPWESDCWGKTPTNTSPNRFRWAGVLTTSAKQICMGEPNSKVYRKVMEDTENVFEVVPWSGLKQQFRPSFCLGGVLQDVEMRYGRYVCGLSDASCIRFLSKPTPSCPCKRYEAMRDSRWACIFASKCPWVRSTDRLCCSCLVNWALVAQGKENPNCLGFFQNFSYFQIIFFLVTLTWLLLSL